MKKRLVKIGSWIIGVAVVVLMLAGAFAWPTDMLMTPLVAHEDVRQSDVIIVLGSGTKKSGNHLPAQAEDRILEGLALYHAGDAANVIFAGGLDRNTKLVESDAMLAYAADYGVGEPTIALDRTSRDTHENAVNSLAIMQSHQWRTALVVTSPYHTKRACAIFRKLGADVRCIVAPFFTAEQPTFMNRLGNFRSVIREYGAWVYNWLRGTV